jgi:hypothetical protein
MRSGHPAALVSQQRKLIDAQIVLINQQAQQLGELAEVVRAQGQELARQGGELRRVVALANGFSAEQLAMLSPRLRRNFLPNDDAIAQKQLLATWRAAPARVLGHRELQASGFRVFSQNDEDGVLLRIFGQIGTTNQYVIEIGSNCSDSDLGIPENLSTNLIVNHGWHGAIFEMDQTECERTRYFFARDFATKHFHVALRGEQTYLSPLIFPGAITPGNIDDKLREASREPEPDLMIIDIDGGDYAVMDAMTAVRPRVLVVEFEKRFRDRHSVVQFDQAQFSKRWAQSGAASLSAWHALLGRRGYTLAAVAVTGYNAFFVRNDVADGKFAPLGVREVFDTHPIFSQVDDALWLEPDETWQTV